MSSNDRQNKGSWISPATVLGSFLGWCHWHSVEGIVYGFIGGLVIPLVFLLLIVLATILGWKLNHGLDVMLAARDARRKVRIKAKESQNDPWVSEYVAHCEAQGLKSELR